MLKNIYSFFKILPVAVMVLFLQTSGTASASITYAPRSVLGTGKWVKVGVEESGIYEISYSSLREMGFTNPEKVAVFGRGGRMLPIYFEDEDGKPLYDDDLRENPVLHSGNKLFFYASGVDNISFSPSSKESCGGRFVNNGLNIYSTKGYYFLTEVDSPLRISDVKVSNVSAKLTSGAGYVYHEQDLYHNVYNSGQLFWGEKFNAGNPNKRSWDVILPGAVTTSPGVMNCAFITERGITGATLSYGMEGGAKFVSNPTSDKSTIYFHYQEPFYGDVSITGEWGKVYVDYAKGDNDAGIANLDYWILTYPKAIPTLRLQNGTTLPQDMIAFSSLMPNTAGEAELKDCTSFEVWDVTDRQTPRRLPVKKNGRNGTFSVIREIDVPEIIVFDTSRTQKQIAGHSLVYEPLGNQNLHAMAKEGAELAIITFPELKESAEKLADLHRRHDGINVVVVTADEVYNEFSAGMPDPMAYRSFARMLYNSPGRKLKNLLLIGPLYGDFRGLFAPKDPQKGLIAYQTERVNFEKGAMNANDILGMIDGFEFDQPVEKQTMNIGVGLLPCYFESELINYTQKVKEYLADDSFAYRINSTLAIGGVANNHIHDTQAIEAGNLFSRHNFNGSINSNLIINAYGNDGARAKLFESLNQGKNFVIYFGHGAPTYIGLDKLFFTGVHINQLRNTNLPFIAFAGCLLSNIDRGQRGLGESIVLDTRHGAIGALLATRDTWSGQNKELMTQFINATYRSNPNSVTSARIDQPQTIGEVFARTKSAGSFENELAFQLICDPAISIPAVSRKMNVPTASIKIIPGQKAVVEGTVLESDEKTIDQTFNGEIVVRLLEPEITMTSEDLVVKEESELEVTYSDIQASMATAKVTGGRFSLTIDIPVVMRRYEGSRAVLNLAAYDPSKRIGASTSKYLYVKPMTDAPRPFPDTESPVIEDMSFDPVNCNLTVVASDNVALDCSQSPTAVKRGFRLYVDGKFIGRGSDITPVLTPGEPRYTKIVNLTGLSFGNHTARVEVADMEGNVGVRELSFDYLPYAGKFQLTIDDAAVLDKVNFIVKGHLPGSAVLHILDKDGNEVFSTPMDGDRYEWDGTSYYGIRLPAGIYKAYIIEDGENNERGHSDVITVPLV